MKLEAFILHVKASMFEVWMQENILPFPWFRLHLSYPNTEIVIFLITCWIYSAKPNPYFCSPWVRSLHNRLSKKYSVFNTAWNSLTRSEKPPQAAPLPPQLCILANKRSILSWWTREVPKASPSELRLTLPNPLPHPSIHPPLPSTSLLLLKLSEPIRLLLTSCESRFRK